MKQIDHSLKESYAHFIEEELKTIIEQKGHRASFDYSPTGIPNPMDLGIDVVEFNSEGKLIAVYEIVTRHAFIYNHRSIYGQAKRAKELTKADEVYVVYRKENDGKLIIIPVNDNTNIPEEVNEYALSRKTPKRVSSFIDYYKCIMNHIEGFGKNWHFYYRGISNKKYPLKPSIYRGYIEKESLLFHEAVRRLPNEFTNDMSTFDKLVKMQHYELPTRLLDITHNPLVALYFACQEDKEKDADGKVLLIALPENQIKYYDSLEVDHISSLALYPVAGSEVFIAANIEGLEIPKYTHQREVYCVLPKLNNERIINQEGAFFIFGVGETKEEPAKLKDDPIEIIINNKEKKSILEELDRMSINEATLFPDKDKVMRQIKNEFTK